MIRETGSSHSSYNHGKSSITIEGDEDEIDRIRAMLLGAIWLRVEDGQVQEHLAYVVPPPPEEDPVIPPKWALPPVGKCTEADISRAVCASYNVKSEIEPIEGYHMPSFYVQHLVGYGWTKEKYMEQARLFTSFGFECLRSRRGRDGKFHEVWRLGCTLFAKGRLKEIVDKSDDRKETWNIQANTITDWLCRNTAFGCLDVAVQRAAMTVD